MSQVKLNPIEDIKVDVSSISESFSHLPTLIYRYNLLLEEAKHRSTVLKAAIEQTEAEVMIGIKNSGEKVTVDVMKAMVSVDARVKKSIMDHADAKREEGDLYGILEALRTKKEALITIAANNRAENK